jgi:hypothetical protein
MNTVLTEPGHTVYMEDTCSIIVYWADCLVSKYLPAFHKNKCVMHTYGQQLSSLGNMEMLIHFMRTLVHLETVPTSARAKADAGHNYLRHRLNLVWRPACLDHLESYASESVSSWYVTQARQVEEYVPDET